MDREPRLSMRGNASVDAQIKVLFDTHAGYHFRARARAHCESIIIDNFLRLYHRKHNGEGTRFHDGWDG